MAISDNLGVPAVAQQDDSSFELIRIWIAEKGQHVSLRSGVWEDPAHWGIMLADLAGHIANTFESTDPLKRIEVLNRIRAGFDAEMDSPTDIPQGSIL